MTRRPMRWEWLCSRKDDDDSLLGCRWQFWSTWRYRRCGQVLSSSSHFYLGHQHDHDHYRHHHHHHEVGGCPGVATIRIYLTVAAPYFTLASSSSSSTSSLSCWSSSSSWPVIWLSWQSRWCRSKIMRKWNFLWDHCLLSCCCCLDKYPKNSYWGPAGKDYRYYRANLGAWTNRNIWFLYWRGIWKGGGGGVRKRKCSTLKIGFITPEGRGRVRHVLLHQHQRHQRASGLLQTFAKGLSASIYTLSHFLGTWFLPLLPQFVHCMSCPELQWSSCPGLEQL